MLHFFWTPYIFRRDSYDKYEANNAEICKHARRVLGRFTDVHLDSFNASRVTRNPADILLGHTSFDSAGGLADDWVRDNALEPGQPAHPNTYLMLPLLPEPVEEHKSWSPFMDSQLQGAQLIFGICGDHWYERIQALPADDMLGRVKDRIVRIDMGCEGHRFAPPRGYSEASMRGLLHMSDLAPHKGFDLLLNSVAGTGAVLHAGSSALRPHPYQRVRLNGHEFVSLGWVDNTSAQQDRFIKDNCAFYIHASSRDAQATAILENCARGLVPMVTPESGFRSPYAIELTQDAEANRAIIARALAMPREEYERRSAGVVRQVLEQHSWDRIFTGIWERIQQDIAGRAARAG